MGQKADLAEVSPEFKKDIPSNIAVLPFENVTDKAEAVNIVRCSFFNHFASKKFQDIELHRIDFTLREKGLYDKHEFLKIPPSQLGKILDADGLIYGRITGFERVFLGVYSQVSVELEVKLVKAATGGTLWRSRHKVTQREGGAPLDPLSAISTLLKTSLNVRDIEFLRISEDLCRTILFTLPEPSIGEVLKTPTITFFTQDSGGKWKKSGDKINVAMTGDPGMVASFNITGIGKVFRMSEETPGVYSGRYTVMPGDTVVAGMVTGHLIDARGNRSDWVDPLGVVNIDTAPPQNPSQPKAVGRDRTVILKWPESEDSDVLEYRIYRSRTPRDGYVEVGMTQLSQFLDTGLENETRYYHRISALDRAGNESDLTKYVVCVPVKPGPTMVSGAIETDKSWFAGASPYVIKEKVTVRNGATLLIEPGTVVQSQGPPIVVRGTLFAQGEKDNAIQLSAEEGLQTGRRWEGIIFDNTSDAQSILAYCKIKQAQTAITIISSSPRIHNCTLTENENGIVVKEFSTPRIAGNMIVNNSGTGVFCERSDSHISENTISENAAKGVHCRNAIPKLIHNNILGNKKADLYNENSIGEVLDARDNWWGSTDISEISQKIIGRVSYARILDAPSPKGKSLEILKASDPKAIARLIVQVKEQIRQGNANAAGGTLQRIVAARPDETEAHFLLGMLQHRMGNFNRAILHMKRSIELDPQNTIYHYNLGLIHLENGETDAALSEWEKVIRLDPEHKNARMFLERYKKN